MSERNAPVLSLLSFGTEHLLKATWIAAHSLRTGELPTDGDLKGLGHRIVAIHDKVIEEAELLDRGRASPGVCTLESAMAWRDQDVAWIKSSRELGSLLQGLESYGSASGRYFDFTTIMNSTGTMNSPDADPKAEWESALGAIWKRSRRDELELAQAADGFDDYLDISVNYHDESADLITCILNRYFRAIGRWWGGGLLGGTARSFSASSSLHQFVTLPSDRVAQD